MFHCNLIAKKNNIDFIWNSKFPINSLNIMRGYLFINYENKDLYLDIMFDAYWKDNLDISNEEILNLLEKCKIKKDIFFNDIENQKIKDELKNITKELMIKKFLVHRHLLLITRYFGGKTDWGML